MPYPTQRNAPGVDRGARENDRLASSIDTVNTPVASRSQPPEKLTVEIVAWRPLERGTLRGFAEVYLPQLKLHIGDITVHRHENGKRWCGLPGKPRLDRDGNTVRAESGKPEYVQVLWWSGRAVSDAFSARVVEALDRYLAAGEGAA